MTGRFDTSMSMTCQPSRVVIAPVGDAITLEVAGGGH